MRINAIQDKLKEHELDGILITTHENRRYVSGFTGGDGLVLITQNDAVLFVDGRYTLQAKIETEEFDIKEFKINPYKLLADFNMKNLCIEDKKLPFGDYKKLKEILNDTHLHDGSWVLDEMRIIKSPEEISSIQKAAEIADKAFEHIIKFVEIGMSEREIALELEFFMRRSGAEGVSFDTIVASSERSALPHAVPTERKIKYGDVLLMDYGCKVNGYCSDMTRTVFIGDVFEKQRIIYNTVLAAQLEGLKNLKSEVKCVNVDMAARNIIEKSGYGANFSHSLGHGVGLEIHENPTLSPKSDKILKPGMVVTVEPGIYVQNLCGVRIEDLVVITDDGYVNLTSSPKEIIVI